LLETNITKMFGIKYPIFNAPIGQFFTRELALATSEAGVLGVLSNVNIAGTNVTINTVHLGVVNTN